jgi:hypothetical protein
MATHPSWQLSISHVVPEQGRVTNGNDGFINLNKTNVGGYGKGRSEGPSGDMELGLHDKKPRLGFKASADLLEKSGTVWYFMEHIAGQRKINRGVGSDILRGTSIGTNAVCSVRSGSPIHHNVEYLLLEVYGNNRARVAY